MAANGGRVLYIAEMAGCSLPTPALSIVPSTRSEGCALVCIMEENFNGVCKQRWLAGLDEQAIAIVIDDRWDATRVGANDSKAASHGLDDHKAERLRVRRHAKDVRRSVGLREVETVEHAQEANAIAILGEMVAELGFVRTAANKCKCRVGVDVQCSRDVLEALLDGEAANVEKHRLVGFGGEPRAHLSAAMSRMENVNIDPLSPDGDSPDALLSELAQNLRRRYEGEVGERVKQFNIFPRRLSREWDPARVPLGIDGQVRVVRHDKRDLAGPCVDDGSEHQQAGGRDVDNIWFKVIDHALCLSLEVAGEADLGVEWQLVAG